MRVVIGAVSLVVFAACAANTGLARCDSNSPAEQVCARLAEPFDMQVGQTAYIADTRLSIRVERVAEDSRCPRGVECVWAGNARVALELRDGETADTASLSSTLEPRAIRRWEYRVELVEVRPQPIAGQALAQSEYRIRLLVNRVS